MTAAPTRRFFISLTAAIGLTTLAACGSQTAGTPASPSQAPATTASAAPTTATPTPTTAAPTTTAVPVKAPGVISHLHSVARDPKNGDLLLATHEGLYRVANGEIRQEGPVVDLMGFAVGPDGTYYASGHPGAGVDLPSPVGLLTSKDAVTWQVASRGGQSDFHALTAGPKTVFGFDGAFRTTTDGRTWTDQVMPAAPRMLAASPTSGTLLATTTRGLLRSTDDGATWDQLSPPKLALLVAWADEKTIVIASTDGYLATSEDAGATWALHRAIGVAEALYAQRGSDGKVEIVVATGGRILSTTDNGTTLETLVS